MESPLEIISMFWKFTILQIDEVGNIINVVFHNNELISFKKIKNIYELFSTEDRFRIEVIMESEKDLSKKYLQLSKKLKEKSYIDIERRRHEKETYIYIQYLSEDRDLYVKEDQYLKELTDLAQRDMATKVLNRYGFGEKVRRLLQTSDYEKRIGIVYVDIDNLKKINDRYGHDVGDKAIKSIADVMLSSLRDRDIITRMGGDEFAIVVEEVTGRRSTADGLARRLVKDIANRRGKHVTTVSIGVHIFEVGKVISKNEEKLKTNFELELNKADKAAYDAKENGRNRVSHSPEYSKYY